MWERFHSYKNLAACFTRIWSLMIILLCKVLIVTFWVHHFTHRQEDERYILPQVISHLTKLTNQTSRHNTFILNQPPTPFHDFSGRRIFFRFYSHYFVKRCFQVIVVPADSIHAFRQEENMKFIHDFGVTKAKGGCLGIIKETSQIFFMSTKATPLFLHFKVSQTP